MKSFICVCVSMLCIVWVSPALAQTQTEEIEPTPRLDVSGFVFLNLVHDENFQRGWNRVRFQVKDTKSPWGFRVEIDGMRFDRDRPWIQQARVEYRATDRTTISFGQEFLSIMYSSYPPIKVNTARYPKAFPFNALALGVQIEHKLDDEWTFRADITGNSDRTVAEGGNFERVESSGYLSAKMGSLNFGFGAQVSRDFHRGGANLGWTNSWMNVGGAVLVNNDRSRKISGIALAEFKPFDFLLPHLQLVFSPNGDTIWTGGIALMFGKYCKVLMDAETINGETDFIARSQLTFLF